MYETSLIYLLFFVSAAALVLGVYQYYVKDYATQKKINRRMSLIEDVSDRAEVMEILRQERGLGGGSLSERFQEIEKLFVQSGVRLLDSKFLLSATLLVCGLTAALTILLGFHYYTLPFSIGASLSVIYAWLARRRAKRISSFSEQLPDVLDVIVRSLKAGHPLSVALSVVGREMPDPAGTEFGIVSDEVTYGHDIPTAIQNLSNRVGAPDLLFVHTSITVQSQTGGNLGEVLSRLARLMRDRFRMNRKVISLSSEGRMTAVVLTGQPVVLFILVNILSPSYYQDVWKEPACQYALGASVVLLFIGNVVMRRMVNFKF